MRIFQNSGLSRGYRVHRGHVRYQISRTAWRSFSMTGMARCISLCRCSTGPRCVFHQWRRRVPATSLGARAGNCGQADARANSARPDRASPHRSILQSRSRALSERVRRKIPGCVRTDFWLARGAVRQCRPDGLWRGARKLSVDPRIMAPKGMPGGTVFSCTRSADGSVWSGRAPDRRAFRRRLFAPSHRAGQDTRAGGELGGCPPGRLLSRGLPAHHACGKCDRQMAAVAEAPASRCHCQDRKTPGVRQAALRLSDRQRSC